MKTKLQKKMKLLSASELTKLACDLDSSVDYLTGHIYYARRVPKKKMMNDLQAGLKLDSTDMYEHFYNNN